MLRNKVKPMRRDCKSDYMSFRGSFLKKKSTFIKLNTFFYVLYMHGEINLCIMSTYDISYPHSDVFYLLLSFL